jgi:hypothetical protein
MSSSTPYDPDEFDNNPFAEPVVGSTNMPYHQEQHEHPATPDHHEEEEEQQHEVDIDVDTDATNTQSSKSTTVGTVSTTVASDHDERLKKLIPERFDTSKKYKILIRVHGIERFGSLSNKKENPGLLFDLQTNLPHFRKKAYKSLKKSYMEFENFFDYLNGAFPECFIPSLPLRYTSYGINNVEDSKTVIGNFNVWFQKIISNPILIRNEEFPYFIDSDFNTYSPINKSKVPASGLKRKTLKQLQPPYDEALELAEFRPLIKSIYQDSKNIVEKLEKLSRLKKTLGIKQNDLGSHVVGLSKLESSHAGMVNMWSKIGKTISLVGDLESVTACVELATLGDGLTAVINDGYVIKEALTNRHLLMRELIQAQSNTKLKHEQARKLKNKRDINPIKVDEAIKALQEASDLEEKLSIKISRITEEMLIEKSEYLKQFDKQVLDIIKLYVTRNIEHERRKLNVLERVRLDVRSVDPNGGLARLGREKHPIKKPQRISSQGPNGDSWNGDRSKSHFSDNLLKLDSPVEFEEAQTVATAAEESLDDEFDAKNAASLLGDSTFS